MATVLSFAVAGVLLTLSIALFVFEARRMMRLARAYAAGHEDAYRVDGFNAADLYLSTDERTEYLRGRRDGWKARIAELSQRRAA